MFNPKDVDQSRILFVSGQPHVTQVEAARLVGIDHRKVNAAVRNRSLPMAEMGHFKLIPLSALASWVPPRGIQRASFGNDVYGKEEPLPDAKGAPAGWLSLGQTEKRFRVPMPHLRAMAHARQIRCVRIVSPIMPKGMYLFSPDDGEKALRLYKAAAGEARSRRVKPDKTDEIAKLRAKLAELEWGRLSK